MNIVMVPTINFTETLRCFGSCQPNSILKIRERHS